MCIFKLITNLSFRFKAQPYLKASSRNSTVKQSRLCINTMKWGRRGGGGGRGDIIEFICSYHCIYQIIGGRKTISDASKFVGITTRLLLADDSDDGEREGRGEREGNPTVFLASEALEQMQWWQLRVGIDIGHGRCWQSDTPKNTTANLPPVSFMRCLTSSMVTIIEIFCAALLKRHSHSKGQTEGLHSSCSICAGWKSMFRFPSTWINENGCFMINITRNSQSIASNACFTFVPRHHNDGLLGARARFSPARCS